VRASKQDYQYYDELPPRQPAPCHRSMCSHMMWKLMHRQACYIGTKSVPHSSPWQIIVFPVLLVIMHHSQPS